MDEQRIPLDGPYELWIGSRCAAPGLDLFNRPEFYELHREGAVSSVYYQLKNARSGEVRGAAHFSEVEAGVFQSPRRGSYGGIEAVEGTPFEVYEQFVRAVDRDLVQRGATRVRLVSPPFAYHPHLNAVAFNVLLRLGYGVANQELNYSIAVDGRPLVERMDYGNRKRVAKCLREDLLTRELPVEEGRVCYDAISANRAKKGFPLTMSWEAILQMHRAIPDVVYCYGVFRREEICAAAICVRINPRILYVFYWGEVPGAESLSPVSQLAAHLYEACQHKKVAILDLGTSTVNGEPNLGLIRYKRNLDAVETLKLTYAKGPRSPG